VGIASQPDFQKRLKGGKKAYFESFGKGYGYKAREHRGQQAWVVVPALPNIGCLS
jgi:hypothetical protein